MPSTCAERARRPAGISGRSSGWARRAAAVVAVTVGLSACGGAASTRSGTSTAPATAAAHRSARRHRAHPARAHTSPPVAVAARTRAPFAVGVRIVTFVDRSRTVRYPGRRPQPRRLVTIIRYPAVGAPSATDVRNATPDLAAGPFPLVVFGHGFAVTPTPYARLLQAWARAGYVVAAPIFPLENANAPGGPNEADLVNQPRDMSFVISRILADNRDRLVDSREIAVSGQSDGGETALAVAYDRFYRDPRIGAAIILSGAEIPGVGGFTFPRPSPPLLATQGTADTINPPHFTYRFFAIAPRPKFLLELLGASHLPPYTYQQPQLGIVDRVTVAFLDRYLKHGPRGLIRMRRSAAVAGVARLLSLP